MTAEKIEDQRQVLQNWGAKLGFTVKLYFDADKRKSQRFIAIHNIQSYIQSRPLNYENLNTWFHGVDTARRLTTL